MGPSGQRSRGSSCCWPPCSLPFLHPPCPLRCREPRKRLQRGEAVEQGPGCYMGCQTLKTVFPRFCSPKAETKQEPVPVVTLRPVQGLGREVIIGGSCLWGEEKREEEPGQTTALPSLSPLTTFLHTLRSRTSQQPNNSFHLPVPRKLLLALYSCSWVPVWPCSLPALLSEVCLSFPTQTSSSKPSCLYPHQPQWFTGRALTQPRDTGWLPVSTGPVPMLTRTCSYNTPDWTGFIPWHWQ